MCANINAMFERSDQLKKSNLSLYTKNHVGYRFKKKINIISVEYTGYISCEKINIIFIFELLSQLNRS